MIAPTPGWFGKLAMLGDFAARRLGQEWVQACDQWLSACVAGSKRELGERWLPAYLSAPVWRFAWGPQVVDAQWWFGVLMPSCDKVGRYFPLVVAQPRQAPPQDRFALDHLELWWSHVAEAALATLGTEPTLEAFEAALRDAPPWPAALPGRAWAEATAGHYAVPEGAALTDVVHGLAAAGMRQRLLAHSFWWPLRAEGGRAPCTLQRGLPDAARFTAMLQPWAGAGAG